MLVLAFIIITVIGLLAAFKLLWPESYLKLPKPGLDFILGRSSTRNEEEPKQIIVDAPIIEEPVETHNAIVEGSAALMAMHKIAKLESLLFEKNKTIDRLQTQLDNEKTARKEFDTVKSVMDEEIKHLREQLRAFRKYHKENLDA